MKMLMIAVFVLFFSSSTGAYAAGFMIGPLTCGDPGCTFSYNLGPYTYLSMNSVLDHSLKKNVLNTFWQYGKLGNGGGNGVIIAFNSETANGTPKDTDDTCITGVILLKPTPGSPSSQAMVNASGCNGAGAYVYSSYDEHPGYDYRAAMNRQVPY